MEEQIHKYFLLVSQRYPISPLMSLRTTSSSQVSSVSSSLIRNRELTELSKLKLVVTYLTFTLPLDRVSTLFCIVFKNRSSFWKPFDDIVAVNIDSSPCTDDLRGTVVIPLTINLFIISNRNSWLEHFTPFIKRAGVMEKMASVFLVKYSAKDPSIWQSSISRASSIGQKSCLQQGDLYPKVVRAFRRRS